MRLEAERVKTELEALKLEREAVARAEEAERAAEEEARRAREAEEVAEAKRCNYSEMGATISFCPSVTSPRRRVRKPLKSATVCSEQPGKKPGL